MAVIFSHMVSLDGYIETPPTYAGPNWATSDDELAAHFVDAERGVAAHVYGRRVYEQVADWWPRAAVDSALPAPMSAYGRIWVEKPKLVVSSTLESAGPNTRIVRADPASEIRSLAAAVAGDVAVYGGALAAALWRDGLIDEIRCYVNPVCIGGGTPMFQGLAPVLRLELLDSRPFACGVILLRYGTSVAYRA